jgi:hypothetical protein
VSDARTERKSIEQSIGEALASGELTGHQLKKVMALGIVGITDPFADAIFRLKYGLDAKSYAETLSSTRKLSYALNFQRNWRLHTRKLSEMAKEALDYWLADTCPACQGRGWEVPEGAPYLSDNPCLHCLDRPGKRPFPWLLAHPEVKIADHEKPVKRKELKRQAKERDHLMKRYKELLCELENHERHIGEKVIVALTRNVSVMGRAVAAAEAEVEGRAVLRTGSARSHVRSRGE